MSETPERGELLALTSEIVSAHVGNNAIGRDQVAALIQSVFDTLSALGSDEPAPAELTPAVPIRRSVTDDYIVCLEDGKKLKMLKRHLMTAYEMTPEQYRAKWGLKPDYPMVAPNYALKRQELAKKIGLGRKPRVVAQDPRRRRQPGSRGRRRRQPERSRPAIRRRPRPRGRSFPHAIRAGSARLSDPLTSGRDEPRQHRNHDGQGVSRIPYAYMHARPLCTAGFAPLRSPPADLPRAALAAGQD